MAALILILIFVFCLGIAAAAVLVGRQLIATYDHPFHKHHFYYLGAFYAFAFYGVWGRIIAVALLGNIEGAAAVVETLASYVPVLGVPFLFVSWLMLINLAYSMFGRTTQGTWVIAHSAVLLLLLAGAVLAFLLLPERLEAAGADLAAWIAGAIIVVELGYFLAFAVIVFRGAGAVPAESRRLLTRFALLLFGAFVLRTASGGLVLVDERLVVIALLIYFGSNLAPLAYVRAVSDRVFEPVRAEAAGRQDIGRLAGRYGITKRERQIVEQICLGKTNQQIADTLFISLQTVKDHTHRIYSKIGINSRLRLVQLVNSGDSGRR